MSQIDDHRSDLFQIIAEAHGLTPAAPVADSALPTGHRWISHTPKPGPLPPRKRCPASEFCDLLAQ